MTIEEVLTSDRIREAARKAWDAAVKAEEAARDVSDEASDKAWKAWEASKEALEDLEVKK